MNELLEKNFILLNGLLNLPRFMEGIAGNSKIFSSSGYQDLHIDHCGHNSISLAHYCRVMGDSIPDPDMVIKIDFRARTAEAMTFQNGIYYQENFSHPRESVRSSLNVFLNTWLNNLHCQGFGEKGLVA